MDTQESTSSAAAAEDSYRAIFDAVSDAILVMDLATGAIVSANRRLTEMFGYTEEEALHLEFGDLSAGTPGFIKEDAWQCIAKEAPQLLEWQCKDKAGQLFWVEVGLNQAAISGRDCLLAVLRAIDEPKRGEREALRKQKDLLQAVLERSVSPVFSVDNGYRYTSFNKSHADGMKALYGAEIRIGGSLLDYMTVEADREKAKANIDRALRGETIIEENYAGEDSLSRLYYQISHTPVVASDGGIAGVVILTVDITDRRGVEESLRASEERYRTLVESMDDSVVVKDRQGRIVLANRENLRRSGRTSEEILGKTAIEATGEEIGRSRHQWDMDVIRTGLAIEVETEDAYTPGRFNLRRSVPLRNDAGEVTGVIVVARDITERKRMEEAWRKSEALYRGLFENMAEGYAYCRMIFEKDEPQDFIYLAVNPAFEALTGLRNVTGKRVSEVIPGIREADPKLFAIYARVSLTGKPEKFEMFVEALKMWFSISVYGPEEGCFVAVFDVITDRKRAEEALRESEERYRTLIESLDDSIVVKDKKGRITFANREDLRQRGKTLEEVLGKTAIEVRVRDIGRSLHQWDMEVIQTGLAIEVETEDAYTPGRFNLRRSVPLRNHAGDVTGVIVVARDITERKRAEEEREKLQSQLIQSQKMESVGRLAGGVAHDFNNMLGVILGHTELALRRIDPGQPLHADLQQIQQAAQRSADLTNQLLAFARKQTVAPKVLDLNETVGGMLTMLRRLVGEDISLAWIPGGGLWQVKVDPSQIDQILANLLVNARDAIGGVGKVTVETGKVEFDEEYCSHHAGSLPGQYVMLAVSDNGCGMDKETQSHLFEPFFTTKELGKGTGLGLSTVYGIVKQNSGYVNVYSEPGQGTTFKIYFPRHVGKAEQVQKDGPEEPAMAGNETVLVVEDEPSMRNLSQLMLEALGYQVLIASTPGEAIRLAEEHAGQIHLLMTDVVMPEMNGRDLAKNLLALYPNLKRLFMSGYTANVIAHHGVLDEGVHFLQKPFTLVSLAAQVRQALSGE